jgi:hypothetical protein
MVASPPQYIMPDANNNEFQGYKIVWIISPFSLEFTHPMRKLAQEK